MFFALDIVELLLGISEDICYSSATSYHYWKKVDIYYQLIKMENN